MEIDRCPVPTTARAPGGRTNAYVIGSNAAVLVDPAARTDAFDRLLAARTVEHIMLTHMHPDHVGAVDDYAAETGATVWARYGRADRFREATGRAPDRELRPGSTIRADDGRIRVLETPGHAPDHLAFEVGEGGPICCGDSAVSEGSVVVGAPEGDMRAYLTALRRLRAMAPPTLYPGHGPTIDEPRRTLDRLIEHRLRRERRVLDAVDAGAETLEDVLKGTYNKDLTGVRDLARATVCAHLEKLAVEGRLEWDGKRAGPM
jgi:endoribonuclease LACTB2